MPISNCNGTSISKSHIIALSRLFSNIPCLQRNRIDKWILPNPAIRFPDELPKPKPPPIFPNSKFVKLEPWQQQQLALKKKFPEGWKPIKRLSPDAIEGVRALNKQVTLASLTLTNFY
ncbi:Required for respiratory growth protein 9, mitochondrial [Neolecta irregularis DAH-3]|uniref:Required for respiratory growth protein 9, mitochondrial n=1 Tax=Neolecta irregularis (strain DAH-3) TaxID=1198029 RepID=A0A1U7LHP1_NEOID|nr:Required for respiratory growth protein 9, mitochondrial [Neolecta irregularis DAH-3]|eukprot:OLL22148.1 Required for respiratory growth protein 9, mitochondrial [Neolecta irregularis DAH-3]